ncbi:hypothetical protein GCM10028808_62770 [Spirosoma migulaei]
MANDLMTCPDTTGSIQPVSAALVRSDTIHPTEPELNVTGDLNLTTSVYALRNQDTTYVLNSPWYLSGTLTLTTRTGWTIPLQGVWSTPASGYGQGYNAIGVSPRYQNWLILHGGYRNVEFSPLTLAGHTFLGAGIELNPGLLRVGFIAGRFNRAVEPSTTDHDPVPAFRRIGYCARLGIGTDRSYLDIILLHVADDARSVRADSVSWPLPAENAVLGLSGRIQANRKLTVELDAAGSAYTSDTRAEAPPITGPADNPFRYLNYLNGFSKLITIRASTSIRTALQASLSYRTTWGDLKLRYKRIEPGYQSMGVYYLQTDVERFTVAPTIRLFKKRLQLRSSLGWQHDNLFNQKRIRTNRLIASASISYASDNNLTVELTGSNYGITQAAGYRPLNDTTRVAQNNGTLSGSVFKCWANNTRQHSLNGSATYQALQDLNPYTADGNQSQNWIYALEYTFQRSAAGLNLNINYSYSHSRASGLSFLVHGPSVSMGKKIGKDHKLCVLFIGSYLTNKQRLSDADELNTAINTSLTLDYQLTPLHRLSVNGTMLVNQGVRPFGQQQGTIQYSAAF